MNALWQTPAVILVFLSWLSAPPANLNEVAQREAIRRASTQKSTASLNNLGPEPESIPPAAVTIPSAEPAKAVDATAKPADAKAADPNAAAKPAEKPRDEAWWRTKVTELRTAVDKGRSALDTLQTRVNSLKADSVNVDDPVKQARARQELGRTLDEFDRVTRQLDADRKAIADLQEEARRSNIPPGWIR